jgi:GNAT-family acetyltransferase (TIGR03103 family)
MEKYQTHSERMNRLHTPTLRNWEKPSKPRYTRYNTDTCVDMGWGRIIFGHTFETNEALYNAMIEEKPGQRDITVYLRDPHVLLSMGPDRFFLDPSHTYRLWAHEYRSLKRRSQNISIRRACKREDVRRMNEIYQSRNMVTGDPDFILDYHATKLRTYLVAETLNDQQIVGTVIGIDHVEAFNDPENGASLWCLAVDPKAMAPGVGEMLVRHLVEHYFTRGRNYVDLSVMHDNEEAIQLYEKVGFQRVPVFCVKYKNSINEHLYTAPQPERELNPYATIIINEARRRGIGIDILDYDLPLFALNMGGRNIICRESLTELTSSVAMMRCDDKRLTHQALRQAGLNVPAQFEAGENQKNTEVLSELERVVVKPARGEQGSGISVDVDSLEELQRAIERARQVCFDVLIEEYVEGEDLRVIVIGFQFVAAAVRRPPQVIGTGNHCVGELIEKYNRRRMAATGGESKVPLDGETLRCIQSTGHNLEDVLPPGESLMLRKTANLHTGGTIHDVTDQIHPTLIEAAEKAAVSLNIPVTGLDLCVPALDGPDYWIIEANERPGLANHEPQPVAERFMDLLFPDTIAAYRRIPKSS